MAKTLTSESTLYHDLARRISSLSSSKKEIRVAVIPRPGHDPDQRPYLIHAAQRLASELASLKLYKTPDREKILKYILSNNYYEGKIISTDKLSKLGEKFSLNLIIYCSAKNLKNKREISAEVISPSTGRILLSASSWRIKGSGKDTHKSISEQNILKMYSIHAFSIFKSDDTFHTIAGRLENLSGKPHCRPVLSINIYYPGSSRVIAAKASCDRDLAPKEILPFRGIVRNLPDLPRQFQIVYDPKICKGKKGASKLSSSRVSFSYQEKTLEFFLDGILESKENKPVYFPSVIVSYFDKNDRFCGSARGFCRLKKLPPYGTSAFRVRVKRNSLKAHPESYQLQYSGILSP